MKASKQVEAHSAGESQSLSWTFIMSDLTNN